MDKYEHIKLVGEGSYGVVMKCRHREFDQMVAIKKFLETEEDACIRKMALREIRMLRRLKHENLVAMIEVFRYRKRFYLVFEYINGTILDELEKLEGGLGEIQCRERLYQIVRAMSYCHSNQIIHRDIKPENVLVSSRGVVKLCDFGFARLWTNKSEPFTDYVATRWYRAPELLVGDSNYGAAVDVWAVGCLFAEMMTGEALFPGESDIDQLYLITKMIGKPCAKHMNLLSKSDQMKAIVKSSNHSKLPSQLSKCFSDWSAMHVDMLSGCLKMDPNDRFTAQEMLNHSYFSHDSFPSYFLPTLRMRVVEEYSSNPLLRHTADEILNSTDRHERLLKEQVQHLKSGYRYWRLHFDMDGAGGAVKRKIRDTSCSERSFTTSSKKQSPKIHKRFNEGPISLVSLPKQNVTTFNVSTTKTTSSQITWAQLQARNVEKTNQKKREHLVLPNISDGKLNTQKNSKTNVNCARSSPNYRYCKAKRKHDQRKEDFER